MSSIKTISNNYSGTIYRGKFGKEGGVNRGIIERIKKIYEEIENFVGI